MFYKKNSAKAGFTLIELLVVISVLSMLASIIFASTKMARAKARDARRMEDLNQIRTALTLYRDSKGDWMETGSGCGSSGNGNGWFNYNNYALPGGNMATKCLRDQGFASTEIIDPTFGRTSTPTSGYAYMKYTCSINGKKQTYIYAKLETLTQSSVATDGTCCINCDVNQGMNYYVQITE